jgi:transglutaminase-like putative cysteine protease
MFIRLCYDIIFDVPAPLPMLLLLHTLPDRAADLRQPEQLKVTPNIPTTEFIDRFGNRCTRLLAPPGELRLCSDFIIEDPGVTLPVVRDAIYHQPEDLPVECLEFLLPSRYCEVDRMTDIAWKLFGHLPPGWECVQGICDWVYANVEFGYQYARDTKSAYEVYEERRGVCRDLTHLAITFCRALTIPARYATGYLGDIGVPVDVNPMDFSACFQVYLGDQWHLFDARHNIRRIGWVLMATGRDAADCAITTSYGSSTLKKFEIFADEVDSSSLPQPRC